MTNRARFKITGSSSGASPSTDAGHDAIHGETLEFEREASTGLVSRTTFEVFDAARPSAPLASLDAPTLSLVGASTGTQVDASSPNAPVESEMPGGADAHSWIVRCTVDGGVNPATGRFDPEYVFERVVSIRTASGLRKEIYGEAALYATRGPADAQNELLDMLVATPPGAADATAIRGIPVDASVGSAGSGEDTYAITYAHGTGFVLAPGGSGAGYATIQNNGAALPQRAVLNFTASLLAADDEDNARTVVDLSPTPVCQRIGVGDIEETEGGVYTAFGETALLSYEGGRAVLGGTLGGVMYLPSGAKVACATNGGLELTENDIRVWYRSQAVEEGHYHGGLITSIVASERIEVDETDTTGVEMLRVALPLLYDEDAYHWDVTVSAVFTGAAGRVILRRTFTVRGPIGSPIYDDDDLGGLVTVEEQLRGNWEPPDLYLDGDEWVALSPTWTETPVSEEAFHRVEVAVIIDRLGPAPVPA